MGTDKEEQSRREFGRWIKGRRVDAGFATADEAAKEAGLSRVTWARYEVGTTTPTRENIRQIARTLRIPVEEVYRRALPMDAPSLVELPTDPATKADVDRILRAVNELREQLARGVIEWAESELRREINNDRRRSLNEIAKT